MADRYQPAINSLNGLRGACETPPDHRRAKKARKWSQGGSHEQTKTGGHVKQCCIWLGVRKKETSILGQTKRAISEEKGKNQKEKSALPATGEAETTDKPFFRRKKDAKTDFW